MSEDLLPEAPPDPDAAAAWEAEIMRRLDEIDAGTAEFVDREELRRRLREVSQRA